SIDGLAAGAAVIGCSAQMVGFAFQSYKDNGFGGFLAQAIGTSMLQVPNVLKKPIIIIPPTIASAVTATLATVWLQMANNTEGAGMGTSWFVGHIMTFETMGFTSGLFSSVLLLRIVVSAIVSISVASIFKKWYLINPGDLVIYYG